MCLKRINKSLPTIFTLVILLLVNGCIPSNLFEGNEKLYFKKIQTPEVELEWFYCSTITFVTADSVKVFSDSLNIQKTLCVSNNIADIYITKKTINMAFYGSPNLHNEAIILPDSIFNYRVVVDSSKVLESPVYRKFFKK